MDLINKQEALKLMKLNYDDSPTDVSDLMYNDGVRSCVKTVREMKAIDEIYKRCAGEHWEDILKSLEPAKVRPIIYCHECKWFYVGEDQKCCINHKGVVVTDEDGFCHHAELREDEEE